MSGWVQIIVIVSVVTALVWLYQKLEDWINRIESIERQLDNIWDALYMFEDVLKKNKIIPPDFDND